MLVLVRHGQSTGNAAGLLLGRMDLPLTGEGVAQASVVGALLGPVTELRSSPLSRALSTAAGLGLGLPIVRDDRWIEVDYGEHDGRPLTEVPAEVWRQWRTEPDFRPEGGETLAEVRDRVGAACAELFARSGEGARAHDGDVVVVSHVTPIKAAVTWALGAAEPLDFRLQLSTGSITRIGWGAGGVPVLHTYNEVPGNRPA